MSGEPLAKRTKEHENRGARRAHPTAADPDPGEQRADSEKDRQQSHRPFVGAERAIAHLPTG